MSDGWKEHANMPCCQGEVPEVVEQLLNLTADEGVVKLGLTPQGWPPDSMIVRSVDAELWADSSGVKPGDEVISVNGREIADMEKAEIVKALKERPVTICFCREVPLPTFTADESIVTLGMRPGNFPPGWVYIRHVDPGSWADQSGIKVGWAIMAVNGSSVESMDSSLFSTQLRARPVTLAMVTPGCRGFASPPVEMQPDLRFSIIPGQAQDLTPFLARTNSKDNVVAIPEEDSQSEEDKTPVRAKRDSEELVAVISEEDEDEDQDCSAKPRLEWLQSHGVAEVDGEKVSKLVDDMNAKELAKDAVEVQDKALRSRLESIAQSLAVAAAGIAGQNSIASSGLALAAAEIRRLEGISQALADAAAHVSSPSASAGLAAAAAGVHRFVSKKKVSEDSLQKTPIPRAESSRKGHSDRASLQAVSGTLLQATGNTAEEKIAELQRKQVFPSQESAIRLRAARQLFGAAIDGKLDEILHANAVGVTCHDLAMPSVDLATFSAEDTTKLTKIQAGARGLLARKQTREMSDKRGEESREREMGTPVLPADALHASESSPTCPIPRAERSRKRNSQLREVRRASATDSLDQQELARLRTEGKENSQDVLPTNSIPRAERSRKRNSRLLELRRPSATESLEHQDLLQRSIRAAFDQAFASGRLAAVLADRSRIITAAAAEESARVASVEAAAAEAAAAAAAEPTESLPVSRAGRSRKRNSRLEQPDLAQIQTELNANSESGMANATEDAEEQESVTSQPIPRAERSRKRNSQLREVRRASVTKSIEQQQAQLVKDANNIVFGSAAPPALRKSSSENEEAWAGCGKFPGAVVWRIEKFEVKRWPEAMFGKFYSGDSYIVLVTTKSKGSEALHWDIFFWIGSQSTTDEQGTAAYKTVELDEFLDMQAHQHREVQGNESPEFHAIFPKQIQFLEGGVESGYHHVQNKENYEPRLLHVRREKMTTTVMQVPLAKDSMNECDCFIVDSGAKIYTWMGKSSSPFERNRCAEAAKHMETERCGHAKVINYEDDPEGFWRLLGGEGPIKEESAQSSRSTAPGNSGKYVLYKLGMKAGDVDFIEAGRRGFDGLLYSGGVFILDVGEQLFVWIGKDASKDDAREAMPGAAKFLYRHGRDASTPIKLFREGRPIHNATWNKVVGFVNDGWLLKRGPLANYAWTRVFCVLTSSHLTLYRDERRSEKKGEIVVNADARVIAFTDADAPGDASTHRAKRPFGFVLESGANRSDGPQRLYYFDAEDQESLNAWQNAFSGET